MDGSALLRVEPPALALTDAESLVLQHYGLAGRAAFLSSERDQNVLLETSDGRRFVLKIANAAESEQTTDFQTLAMRHIAARDPAIPIQRLLTTLEGEYAPNLLIGGARCTTRLMTYLDGKPRHLVPTTVQQRRNIAACLARIDLALVDFEHPGAQRDLIWDVTHAGRTRTWLEHVADPDRRGLAERFLDRFDRYCAPVLAGLRRQVIHNDMNPHNVLVREDNPDELAGVLDFGDALVAPLVNDVAVAAAYETSGPGSAIDGITQFVAAYHAVVPLQRDELEIVVDLVAARQVLTAVITEWRAQRYPENRAYILRNNPAAWLGLAGLAGEPREDSIGRVLSACGVSR